MKTVVTVVTAWCDYPDCADDNAHIKGGQETFTVEFWVYTSGRGRKTAPITIELCMEHRDQLKNLYANMAKFDQKPVS